MSHPLIVDLDGTLIHTDMLHESALRALRASPLGVLRIPLWLGQGKAVLKRHLANGSTFNPEALPYNLVLLDWLRQQKRAGRRLILCTASDQSIALAIAAHLDLFDEVMASDGVVNLAGENKAAALEARFGRAGFDYAGNSDADLHVWRRARRAVVVNAAPGLTSTARASFDVEQVFAPPARGFSAWRKVLRVHQWLKNLLLFVPLAAAHMLSDAAAWQALLQAFIAFSLCASTVYIANDLLDLESDRLHPRKRLRPFASGAVPAWMGVATAPLMLVASFALAFHVGVGFAVTLAVYFVLTCVYSFLLKRLMLVDCLTLAVLYTLRIIAGAAAANNTLSFWLLAFSVFLFLSLAFVKRYAEMHDQRVSGKEQVHGRGYVTSDASLVQMLGVTAGYAAAVVLALYLNSEAVLLLYQTPEVVWGVVPVLLFWISWIWMKAHRGQMHDDPLVFAVKDRASLISGVVFALVLGAGTIRWSW